MKQFTTERERERKREKKEERKKHNDPPQKNEKIKTQRPQKRADRGRPKKRAEKAQLLSDERVLSAAHFFIFFFSPSL